MPIHSDARITRSISQDLTNRLDWLILMVDNMENMTRAILKGLTRQSEHLKQVCFSEHKLSNSLLDDMSKLDDDLIMKMIFNHWNSFAAHLKVQVEEYCQNVDSTFGDSLRRILMEIGQFRCMIRANARAERKLTKLRLKYDKLQARPKTASNMVKLGARAQQIDRMQSELTDQSASLIESITKFLVDSPRQMLQPVECYISAEKRWFQACERSFEHRPTLRDTLDDKSTSERLSDIGRTIDSMSSLSIVSLDVSRTE